MAKPDKIISIDISSNKVKVGIVSDKLDLESVSLQGYSIIDEDINGFAKHLKMDNIWNKVKIGIKNAIKKNKPENIIGISSCGQRIASVFLDQKGNEIYGGPNTDIRGIDSAYLIEDEFSEKELFNITAHSPSLMFTLARLLWFREEKVDQYENIGKILMLDDWIGYKLTGMCYTDYASICESQLFNIKTKEWSNEIIEAFNINSRILPEIIYPGTIIGGLKSDLMKEFGLYQKKVPVIKGCGDTQANLLGMGATEYDNIGITLGTTAPVHLVVKNPLIDPNMSFWTECHVIKDAWLIEANAGGTGMAYDWFKDAFISESQGDKNAIIDDFLSKTKPGAGSTYIFLGPELMAVKDQTSIKRGVFIFQPPSMVGEELPRLEHFTRSVIENICFGIFQNFQALKKFTHSEGITFCAGGMSKSEEIIKILTNILKTEIKVPNVKDSAFIGNAINTLIGLKLYPDYKSIIKEHIKYKTFEIDSVITEKYKSIFTQWKNFKKKVDMI
ncbi:MAG: FGGY family carbohydrate kinase [Candidatus Thorarchaeota archaeon]